MRTQKITFLLAGLLFCWSGVFAKYALNVSCNNTITAIANGSTGPYYFTWTDPSGNTLNPDNNTINQISALQTGTYSVIITNAFECETILDVLIGDTSCKLNNEQFTNEISVYPNPFSKELSLDYKSDITTSATIQITNLVGTVVYKQNLQMRKGSNSHQIDLHKNFSNGIYMFSLQIGGQPVRTVKMIKD